MPISSVEYAFVVDTSSLGSRILHSMFSFVTGKRISLDEDEELHSKELRCGRKALGLNPDRAYQPNPFFDGLLEMRMVLVGNEGRLQYATITSTPGTFLQGGEVVLRENGAQGKEPPAWASVCLFLRRLPTSQETAFLKKRVREWEFEGPAKVTGFRLLWSQTTWSETSVDD